MEGKGDNLPQEKGAEKGSAKTKTIAIVVVLVLIIAAVLGAFLLMGGGNKSPTAKITASSDSITLGATVTFNGNQSSDPDGSISEYKWYFGDGTNQTTTTNSVTYTYTNPGDYLVVLKVKDDKGAEATTWLTYASVKVLPVETPRPNNNTAPVVNIATDNTIFNKNTVVLCDGNSSAAWKNIWDPASRNQTTGVRGLWKMQNGRDFVNEDNGLKWVFLDTGTTVWGNMSNNQIVTHTYTTPGMVTAVQLTVKSWSNVQTMGMKTVIVLPDGTTVTSGIKNPDVIISATSGEPESLDPAYDYESAGGEVLQNVYETLVWYNGTSPDDLIPMLATSVPTKENGGISADGKNYTFNLRSGVKFHDGTTLTGYDVFYSMKRMLMENNAYSPAWMVGEVLIPNYYDYDMPPFISDNPIPEDDINVSMEYTDTSITFHLQYAFPAFIKVIAYTACSVVSHTFVEAHGGIQRYWRNTYMDTHECGTGPFKVTSWVKGAVLKMERFADYWKAQKSKVKYVYIEKYESMATRQMLLAKGDADLIYVPYSASEPFVKTPNANYYVGRGNYTFNLGFLGFNWDINADPAIPIGDVPSTFFSDINVRLAFCHGFNISATIKEIYKGNAIQPNGPIPAGMFGYDESIKEYEFDPALAASYLKKAINPGTGNSWADDGFELKVYYNIGNDDRERACIMLKQNMESLTTSGLVNGTIRITYQGLDWASAYLPAQRGLKLAIFFLGWAPDYADPHDYAYPFLHSTGTYPQTCGWGNTSLDALIEAAAREEDLTARAALYSEISQACQDNGYYMWTGQPTDFNVMRSWIKGYINNPMYSNFIYYPMYKSAV